MAAASVWRRLELREADMARRGWGARGADIRKAPTSDPQQACSALHLGRSETAKL